MSATITSGVSTSGVSAAPEAARDARSDAREERWSARRTIAFVVLVCGLFWLGVGALVSALIQAL